MSEDASTRLCSRDRPRILVLVMRRLGDVFLTTPLIRTLRRGFIEPRIDVLVFRGTEGILAGNPDINSIWTLPPRPSARDLMGLVRKLWRRYDLAISTQSGDRPTFLAAMAGRRRIGLIAAGDAGWKRRVLNASVIADASNHRVNELLRLADELGIERETELVCPQRLSAPPVPPTKAMPPYAVLHANPMYRFRRWTDEGWRSLAHALRERGLAVAVTGSAEPAERRYLDALWGSVGPPVERFDGRLGWPELVDLITGAQVYVGPDTSVTHLAAGTGCPTVALYGPASPQHIGPWPVGGLGADWSPRQVMQRRGNVWIVQNPMPCMPCEKLGCEGHYESPSRCLDELSAPQVLAAVDQALARSSRKRERENGSPASIQS
jgi:heptosyltransferase-3